MIKFKVDGGGTVIDNVFIDEYMAQPQSAVFSLIYIYALRCALGNIDIDNGAIAEKFGILESDVVKAWKYWEQKGLLALHKKGEYQIEFLTCNNSVNKEAIREVAASKAPKDGVIRVTSRPSYNPTDIEKVSSKNPEVSELFNMAQMLLAKTLAPNDINIIFGLYDWLGLPLEVIAVLLTYCGKNRKPISYIEKTGIDWAEKGIATPEMAEDYLNMFYTDYTEILKCFGVVGRLPSEEEQGFMYSWLKKYKMPVEVVKIACNKTIKNTGQISFPYADTIIKNWDKKGIKTVVAVEKEEKDFAKKTESNKAKPKKATATKNNKFINYEQREYNPEELKDIERMLLDKEARR